MSKALLYDSTVCIGCKQCEQACAAQNDLSYDDGIAGEEYQSAHKLTCVLTRGDKFMRRLCMNCEDPSCASVCPVGALKKTALGPVTYDPSKCMGCRYCMVACPFSVPKYEWGKLFPKVQKCVMCPDRVAQGKQTACAEICPTGATKFGERDDLVASNYREGCAVAPIVLESTPGSDQLSDATRRAFQDLIATLAARFTEKGLPHERALQLATNVWTSVEGALILSRVLRSPEPFDMATALLTAAADQVDSDR